MREWGIWVAGRGGVLWGKVVRLCPLGCCKIINTDLSASAGQRCRRSRPCLQAEPPLGTYASPSHPSTHSCGLQSFNSVRVDELPQRIHSRQSCSGQHQVLCSQTEEPAEIVLSPTELNCSKFSGWIKGRYCAGGPDPIASKLSTTVQLGCVVSSYSPRQGP